MKTILVAIALATIQIVPGPAVTYYRSAEPQTQYIQATVTAYTSSPDETDDTPETTASGERTREGIAACPSRYAFGTRIVIEGAEYECQDRMHSRYRNDNYFDIWKQTKREAFEWGRRQIAVEVRGS